jgi:hypothetical protein
LQQQCRKAYRSCNDNAGEMTMTTAKTMATKPQESSREGNDNDNADGDDDATIKH